MIEKIKEFLPLHDLSKSSSPNLYIVDYKDLNGGDVMLLENEPNDIKFVHIENPPEIEIVFDGFKDNALPLGPGEHNSQCEGLLFPSSCGENDWILFVEAKYANNLQAALNKERDYPNCMINQISETVKYFRDKGIIPDKKRVHALVSFPNLVEQFNGFFSRNRINHLLFNERIVLRPTNKAKIISPKRIDLH